MQLGPAVHPVGEELELVPAVAKGIVDQVAEGLLQPEAVAADRERRRPCGSDDLAFRRGAPLGAAEHRREEVVYVKALDPEPKSAAIRARDQEQGFGELREAVGFLRGAAYSLPQLLDGPGLAERQLELRAEKREWRAKLVAGVRDEAALPLEGELEPIEHLVQGLAQPLELVPGRRDG